LLSVSQGVLTAAIVELVVRQTSPALAVTHMWVVFKQMVFTFIAMQVASTHCALADVAATVPTRQRKTTRNRGPLISLDCELPRSCMGRGIEVAATVRSVSHTTKAEHR
jgi:hypothetical protein